MRLQDGDLLPADRAAIPAWDPLAAAQGRAIPFSAMLRVARLSARLTQEDAARVLGVAPGTLARWEQGLHAPPSEARVLTRERVLRELKTWSCF